VQDLKWMPHKPDNDQTELENKTSFVEWKRSLAKLGIPLSDIMRVLAAALLIGNMEYDSRSDPLVGRVAKLLGVEQKCLVGGLWRRTQSIRGTLVTRDLEEKEWEMARTGLASSLYMRTVYMIIRRVNSHHVSPVSDCEKTFPPPSFIGILDMFGWQSSLQSACSMEQLCMNLCSEHLLQLYNTSTISSDCSDIAADIHLVSSAESGLFQCLDRETHRRGDSLSLVNTFHSIHRTNQKLFKPDTNYSSCFGIKHYMGPAMYDASHFVGKLLLSYAF
jgi:myosin heavy subunit